VVILTVEYDSDWLSSAQAPPSPELTDLLVEQYNAQQQRGRSGSQAASCVVQINASTVASSVAKGLQGLYRRVVANKGAWLVCVGWPAAYQAILQAFLPSGESPNFAVANNLKEGLAMVRPPQPSTPAAARLRARR